jgi:hypothetical protein
LAPSPPALKQGINKRIRNCIPSLPYYSLKLL